MKILKNHNLCVLEVNEAGERTGIRQIDSDLFFRFQEAQAVHGSTHIKKTPSLVARDEDPKELIDWLLVQHSLQGGLEYCEEMQDAEFLLSVYRRLRDGSVEKESLALQEAEAKSLRNKTLYVLPSECEANSKGLEQVNALDFYEQQSGFTILGNQIFDDLGHLAKTFFTNESAILFVKKEAENRLMHSEFAVEYFEDESRAKARLNGLLEQSTQTFEQPSFDADPAFSKDLKSTSVFVLQAQGKLSPSSIKEMNALDFFQDQAGLSLVDTSVRDRTGSFCSKFDTDNEAVKFIYDTAVQKMAASEFAPQYSFSRNEATKLFVSIKKRELENENAARETNTIKPNAPSGFSVLFSRAKGALGL